MVSPLATACTFAKREGIEFHKERHQQLISDAIVEADNGTGPRFIVVSMPPQHGKSTIITRRTPEWYLAKYPNRKVGIAGYGAEFAREWGRVIREDLKNHYDLLGWKLSEDSQKANLWHTDQGGELWTAGTLSGANGRGAHLFIMDDPVKNFQEANSSLYRERIWDEWMRVFFARVQQNGIVLVVMTRWHIDDLAGRLLGQSKTPEGETYGDPSIWREIRLPAVYESATPTTYTFGDGSWTRSKGDVLCPNRYDAAAFEIIKSQNDTASWECLYQQNPWKVAKGMRIYYDYDEMVHERHDLERDMSLPFFWTLDFNVTPMSSCFGQWREMFGPRSHLTNEKIMQVEVLDEISLVRSNVPAACDEFLDRFLEMHQGYHKPIINLYGDSAGRAASHAGPDLSSWAIVKKFLTKHGLQYNDWVPSGPPAIKDRVNSMNNALKNANGVASLWHSPKCRALKSDFLNVAWKMDSNGAISGHQDPGPKNQYTHMTDALGYMIHTKFAVRGRFGQQAKSIPR